jgi:hypothetical protein
MIAAKIAHATDVYVDIIPSKNLKETISNEFGLLVVKAQAAVSARKPS